MTVDTKSIALQYSVVIPCYNSALWLDDLVNRIKPIFSDHEFEIVLVNDCSTDGRTWDVIKALSESNPCVVGVDLQFNVGQFKALMAGMGVSKAPFVITMDDDLQHPPEEIPKLIATIQQHPDVDAVVGAYRKKEHHFVRNLGRRLVNAISKKLYAPPKAFESSAFRIMKRPLVDSLLMHRTMRPVMGALILKNTKRLMNVEVEHHRRKAGRSGYRLSALLSSTFDNIIDSSTFPLKLIGTLGILISFLSVLMSCLYLILWLFGQINAPGFITLVLLITFFGGMTLLSIGLVGEYLSRVVAEVSNSPRYVLREIISGRGDHDKRES